MLVMALESTRKRIADAVLGAHARWDRTGRTKSREPGGRANDHVLRRSIAMIAVLAEREDGLTLAEICDEMGVSRATVYRDLDALHRAGVSIENISPEGHAAHWRLGQTLDRAGRPVHHPPSRRPR